MSFRRWRSWLLGPLLALAGTPSFAQAEVPSLASASMHNMAPYTSLPKTQLQRSGDRKAKARTSKAGHAHRKAPVTVPIDVGLGPIMLMPNPPLFHDQALYAGALLSLAAVIDRELIAAQRGRVPKAYRHLVAGVGQARVRPLWLALVPSTLVLSPAWVEGLTTTGMYGAIWRPLGAGVDLLEAPARLNLHADVALSYLYLHSSLRAPTHFLRPGVTLSAVFELPLTERLLISTGWSSDLYVPQPLSSSPFSWEPSTDWLWHLGGPFVKLHLRFPYEVSL